MDAKDRIPTPLRLHWRLLIGLSALSANALPAAQSEKPNIVLIFIDDMGYGDIGPFGNRVNKTPQLDRMASEGLVLRQFYVSNTACTPSRAALMTGTYASRIGMDGRVCFPGERRGPNPSEITIAELLKTRGYATGCFGKWHLGDQPEFMPLAQGFDEYFGIPYSNDMWPGNKRGNPLTKRGPYTPLPIVRQNKAVAYVSPRYRITGHSGKGLVNSFLGGDKPTGKLTSPELTIQRKYLCFLVGGGRHRGKTCMNLVVEGKVVRRAVGSAAKDRGHEIMEWVSWDVAELAGKKAKLQIVDAHRGGWGHINIDHIVQRSSPVTAASP